ncbi:Raf kinase inhibitor-like YbhB/YbcL family protein [Janthinobacterium sp. CG_23.3]|uniref:YbhB/YbcL family Raf kinase inhibitor-like protein n=1 Tax=Janthinobacterium sp. CG_23.3 TaxID=3349634 RepID=UPI0038D3CB03
MSFRLNTALLAITLACPLWASAADFTLSSPDLGVVLREEQVFKGFGCSGKNLSPALQWQGVPAAARSLAVTVYDPDAPTGSGWWHWQVVNLAPTLAGLAAGAGDANGAALPAGALQGRNDYGTSAFGGACPPAGDKPHRYIFTVHALKVAKLDVPAGASAALIGYMINANALGTASLTAHYGR